MNMKGYDRAQNAYDNMEDPRYAEPDEPDVKQYEKDYDDEEYARQEYEYYKVDDFKDKLIELRASCRMIEKNTSNGTGVLPINETSKVRAELLNSIIVMYDKHFSRN